VKTSKEYGLKSYVHIGVWEDAREAIKAGAVIINHLGESSIPDDLVGLAKENNVYWIPTLALYQDYLNILNDPNLLNDTLLNKVAKTAAINSYLPENIYRDKQYIAYQKKHTIPDAINVKKLNKGGIRLVAGSDTIELGTFIGWSLHREMALFVKYGLTEWESLATATINAGDMLGYDFGIDPGSEGSVLVLNASPIENIWNTTKIEKVIHKGRLLEF
jgi:imidazolonepropionase-like amidohydrolase